MHGEVLCSRRFCPPPPNPGDSVPQHVKLGTNLLLIAPHLNPYRTDHVTHEVDRISGGQNPLGHWGGFHKGSPNLGLALGNA